MMDQAETLRLMKAEVQNRGLSVPMTWNDALVTAMLGSTSGANVVYGMVCLLDGRHVSTAQFIRETVARQPKKARKAHRRELLALFGKAPVTTNMLRKWHRVARAEGNARAGEDMRVDRSTFDRSDGVVAHYDLMDNGDAVLRLVCPRCNTANVRRWRAVDIESAEVASQRQYDETARALASWHTYQPTQPACARGAEQEP